MGQTDRRTPDRYIDGRPLLRILCGQRLEQRSHSTQQPTQTVTCTLKNVKKLVVVICVGLRRRAQGSGTDRVSM